MDKLIEIIIGTIMFIVIVIVTIGFVAIAILSAMAGV
jgi:hypothetical protein